jgi:hypothetical protein
MNPRHGQVIDWVMDRNRIMGRVVALEHGRS